MEVCSLCHVREATVRVEMTGGIVYLCSVCSQGRECENCFSIFLQPPRFVSTLHLRCCKNCIKDIQNQDTRIESTECSICKTTFYGRPFFIDGIVFCHNCLKNTRSTSPFTERMELKSSS